MSTWVASIFALVCGVVLGLLFTIAHRASISIAGLDVPIGIVLGLVAVTAFLTGLRLMWDGRLPALGAAIGIVGTEILLSAQSDGGSVLIADGTVGAVWLVAPSIIAAIVLAWPRALPRRAGRIDEPVIHPSGDPS